ncbi:MAG TPA: antitoxin Xre/MbcA/ParS toxin-binding domain-containing protein [Thermomicrobiales bacterium]|jgi:hypothetical protein
MKDRRTALATVAETELDPELSARLAQFPDIAQLALAVYTPEGVRLFMTEPSSRFDGRTALELLESGDAQRVLSALAADYEWLS